MQYYYNFKAIIFGTAGVGKQSLIKSLDQQSDGSKVILMDRSCETIYIYEFLTSYEYYEDAICFIAVFDQSNPTSLQFVLNKIQKNLLHQLNRAFQFIVLVQNKSDLPNRLTQNVEAYAIQNQIVFVHTSTRNNFNITLLQNILKIKAVQIMKKYAIQPQQLKCESDSLENTPNQRTPDRPLPETPDSSDYKSIQSEVVQIDDFEIDRIQNQIRQLDDRIETKSHQNLWKSVDLVRKENNPLAVNLSANLNRSFHHEAPPKKVSHRGVLSIVFHLNGQTITVDVYKEDSYQLIAERLCSQSNRKVKSYVKKHLARKVETQMTHFIAALQQLIIDKKYSRQHLEQFFIEFSKELTFHKCPPWRDPKNAIGQLILLLQAKVHRIYIHKNDDSYEVAFNAIVDYNLKRSTIQSLVDRITHIQNPKNATQYWIVSDFLEKDLIVYVGESLEKKFYQFALQEKLEFEQYRMLQQII